VVASAPHPSGAGTLRLAAAPLGLSGESGLAVVGSDDAAFPTQTDRLLLGVAANQAAIVLQQRRSEEQLRGLAAIVESSEDAILGLRRDGRITSWNRGAARLYGYTEAEAVGREVSFLIPPDHADDFPVLIDRLRRGERIEHFETERLAKDGRRIDVSLTISPIRDASGAVVGASKIARDITERKRTAEALARQTERLRLLSEAAMVLLAATDPDTMLRGVLAKIGPHLGVDAYFNYALDEPGRAARLLSHAGLDAPEPAVAGLDFGQQAVLARPWEAVAGAPGERADDPAAQAVRAYGIRAWVASPLLAGGRLFGALVFASRGRERFDESEAALLQTISRYVAVAYERLRLLKELKESDRRKDEFLATLAHELRNPLAPVRNAVQVLRLKGPDEPELRWGRDVILRQVEHLTRLVDDLMDVSRITRDKLDLRRERIDLADVIRGAVESSRPTIEQWSHDLTVTLPPRPIFVHGDLVRLAQVFLNLLNNAAKYTERGGRIWLTAEQRGPEVVVSVRDTGIGIPPDKLEHLFQMFFQVDRTRERAQEGLGIGLALVRRLVELHGGSVEARSEGPGKGSEFIVHLPVLVETPAPASNAGPEAARGPSRRILVVDDNRDSADSLAMLLQLGGNEVETAYDGMEAVEAAERFRPDVALLDIGMPRMNGEAACRRIRERDWGEGMVLIALTGWGQEEDRLRTVDAGFDGHMVKPVDPAALMRLLAETRRPPRGRETTRS
jgi:PAS domain S-box-containing protein